LFRRRLNKGQGQTFAIEYLGKS